MHQVAVIGMGKTGCSIVHFLQSKGVSCTAFDEQNITLPTNIHCPLICGILNIKILQQYDTIAVSPGINWQHPVLKTLRSQGKNMVSDLDIFDQYFQGSMVAVTGTNGKTTVVTLLHQLLNAPAVGNIGTPMLDILDTEHTQAVLELSSFQLQRSGLIHPHYAILLNVQPDHLDMHADAKEYEQAKLQLFAKQSQGNWALLPDDLHWNKHAEQLRKQGVCVRRFGAHGNTSDVGWRDTEKGKVIFWQQGKQQMLCADMAIKGHHQHMNLAVVAQVTSDLGVESCRIRDMIKNFSGLAHRMQYIGHYHHRDWFNDSKATNPDAAIAALKACDKVGWICGGLRKGIDLRPMIPAIQEHVCQAWVIGTEPDAYADVLQQAGIPYEVVGQLSIAVEHAKLSPTNTPILLSPASASMDQFLNYAQRGNDFIRYITT